MSNTNPPSPVSRWLVWCAVLALAAYGVLLAANTSATAGGSDSSGYLNSARLLASGRLVAPLRTVPEMSVVLPGERCPLGFIAMKQEAGMLAPTYPVGLPLHLAAAGATVGWSLAPIVVGVGGALAALVLMYLVGRELGLTPWLAGVGAAVFGLFPITIFIAIQPLSDLLAATWCLAAVWTALRARRSSPGWSVACGAAVAVAVMVRPTNVLLLPAVVLLLGRWRPLLGAFLGGLPGALWLGFYNHRLYDAIFTSGYGSIFGCLETVFFAPTMVHFAKWLALFLPALCPVLPLAALCGWRTRRRELTALALWAGAFVGFYAFYNVSHETWWCLRFILPGVPAIVLGAMLGVAALLPADTRRWRVAGALAGGALLAWAAGNSYYWTKELNVFLTRGYERDYADACHWLNANLPPTAVVSCMGASGAVYFYTDFPVLRWDQIKDGDFAKFERAVAVSGRPVYALLFQFEQEEALTRRMPARWDKVAGFHGAGIWKLTSAP